MIVGPNFLSLTKCNGERRQPGRDLHLHVDGSGLDPLKGYGGNALDQMVPLCRNER